MPKTNSDLGLAKRLLALAASGLLSGSASCSESAVNPGLSQVGAITPRSAWKLPYRNYGTLAEGLVAHPGAKTIPGRELLPGILL